MIKTSNIALYLLTLALISSCESDKISEQNESLDFAVEVVNGPIIIDQPTELKISSNFQFNQIHITDGNVIRSPNIWELTNEETICYVFPKNTQLFDIELSNLETKQSLQKQIEMISNRGDGIKIKQIEITSFVNQKLGYEIGDFNNNEDFKFIQFDLFKHVKECVGTDKDIHRWFLSKTLDRNVENLVWNLDNENVFINDEDYVMEIRPFYINNSEGKIREVDAFLILPSQLDLLNADFFYEDPIRFTLKDYSREKPESVVIRNENLNFEMKIQIEW